MPLVHFLLVFDRKAQRLVFEQPYTDPGEALPRTRRWRRSTATSGTWRSCWSGPTRSRRSC